jgi:lipopolysaccharide transport system permease protein
MAVSNGQAHMPELNLQSPDEEREDFRPVTVIERTQGWFSLKLSEVWEYHELLYFLIWREVKVRYKQTAIGAAWAVLQPFMTMVIFTVVFEKLAKVPSDGLPYPVFSFSALLPWNYFSRSLNACIVSVVGNAQLITKVYFPRLLLPVSAILSGLIDLAISFVFLLGMMIWYHESISPTWGVLLLPFFVVLTMLTALSISLWLCVINVRYRDVGQATPLLTQLWLFASPVAYPVSIVPEKWRLLYSLNPMVGVIEGFRWALLGEISPPINLIVLSTVSVLVLLWGGAVFFKRMEHTFADIV